MPGMTLEESLVLLGKCQRIINAQTKLLIAYRLQKRPPEKALDELADIEDVQAEVREALAAKLKAEGGQ